MTPVTWGDPGVHLCFNANPPDAGVPCVDRDVALGKGIRDEAKIRLAYLHTVFNRP
jgi:hypothetical protein